MSPTNMRAATAAAALAVLLAGCATAAPLAAVQLKTNYMSYAPVIDDSMPRFSWAIESGAGDRGVVQSAYQILVNVTSTGASVWDSGKVASNMSIGIMYMGAPLVSSTAYAWTVTWWNNAGVAAPTSQRAFFETGLFTQAEWSPSQWIGCTQPASNMDRGPNQLRTEFTLALPAGVSIASARAYVTGVGYYRAFINGERLGANVHQDPAWTIPLIRVLYSGFNVAPLLNPRGLNVVAAYLGNGWEDVDPNPYK